MSETPTASFSATVAPPWFLGIDPGAKGGLAVLAQSGACLLSCALPGTPEALAEALRPWTIAGQGGLIGAVERVGPRPGEGVVSVATFARGYGVILGVLAAFRVSFVLPAPQVWQSLILGRGRGRARTGIRALDRKASKASAVAWVRTRWPGMDLREPGCRVAHDGRADALCLAEYARRAAAASLRVRNVASGERPLVDPTL